jgi:HEAT repeat protein
MTHMSSKSIVLAAALAVAAVGVGGCAGSKQQWREPGPPRVPAAAPAAVATPIDPALRQRASQEILSAATSGDQILRTQAMEAIQVGLGASAADKVVAALDDPSARVRFAAALTAGQLQLRPAYEAVLRRADDPNPHVAIASLFALHRLGDTRRSQEIVRFTQHPQPGVRANAAMVLGLLNEPSAAKVLKPLTTDGDTSVRIQAAESLWRLNRDQKALEDLVAYSVSQAPDDAIIALLALAGPRDKVVAKHVGTKLTADYVEITLAATRALGMLGYDNGYAIAAKTIKTGDSRQKIMAARALGAIGRSDAQPLLAPLLTDADPSVRLAASVGLLEIGNAAGGAAAASR